MRIVACLVLLFGANFRSPAQSTPSVLEKSVAGKDGAVPFSVAGDWNVTHPDWKSPNTITIHPDGTFTVLHGTSGKWILSADGGTPLLVLRWEMWGTESLAMITPDHFRGQKWPDHFIDMRRNVGNAASKRAEREVAEPGFLGTWHVQNLADGIKATYAIKADNTFERDGRRTGTWEVKNNQLTLRYEGGGFERYELPAPAAQLNGANDPGQALTMTRKPKD